MKYEEKDIRRILDESLSAYRDIPQEDVGASVDRVWESLKSSTKAQGAPVASRAGRAWRWPAVAAIAAAIAVVIFLPSRIVQSAPAVLQDADGSRKIQFGEVVQPSGDMSAMLSMASGAQVEMRSMSEFSLERAEDGVRIRLERGGLIVDAAAQRTENLYVQTKDLTASVSGAVSLVKAEEDGSRVAAIGGQVRVHQGEEERKLGPGEQVATNPTLEKLPVQEDVTWSRQAAAHLAMLQQASSRVPQVREEQLAFEVATIRPSAPAPPPLPGARGGGGDANSRPTKEGCVPDSAGFSYQLDPRRLAVYRTSMYQLIALAYPVEGLPGKHPFMNCLLVSSTGRMFGGPEWLKREMWDLQAAIAEGVMSTTTAAVYPGRPGPDWERLWIMDPKVHQMLQTLLAERIKLVIRKETREMPVYLLKVGKDGAKFNGHGEAFQRMRFLDNDGKVKPASELPPPADGSFAFLANNIMEVQNASMENFANTLFGLDGRPVLDRTGLTGRYDFHYSGAPAPLSVEKIGETLSNLKRDAVKAMGLELEESRANYDVWVIVSAERPSEN